MPSPSLQRPSRDLLVALALLAAPLQAADFNGDGYADLAIGCRGELVNGFQEAGAVHVLYGGPLAFGAFTDLVITEASFPDLAAPGDFELFGLAVTSGDFDGDGFDDLAICAGNEDVDGYDAAGTVFVTYGSADGIDLDRHAAFHQNTKGIKDKVEPGNFFFPDLSAEQFGRTMASGDFDGDGHDDLALYVVETFGSKKKPVQFAGAIHVLRGGPDGLTVKKNKLLRQGKGGVPGKAQESAKFGWALAVADFDQDGLDDLAVGAPGSSVVPGSVIVLHGKLKKGLTGKKAVLIDEVACGATLEPGASNSFGWSLAAGAFSGGAQQLAIGTPTLDLGGAEGAGGLWIVRLASDLSVDEAVLVTRETGGLDGGVHAGAQFGYAVEAGDFDGDAHDDLAIGCPYDLVGAADDAGSVTLLAGSPGGLTGGSLLLHQDATGVPETAEAGDFFGTSLAAADYDDDGLADLIVGAWAENVSGFGTAGGVLVAHGDGTELLDLGGSAWLDKTSLAIPGSPGSNDAFGSALGD